MINAFLIGTLGQSTFIFWGIWMALAVIIYLCYGLHHSQGEGDHIALSAARKDSEQPYDDASSPSAANATPGGRTQQYDSSKSGLVDHRSPLSCSAMIHLPAQDNSDAVVVPDVRSRKSALSVFSRNSTAGETKV